MDTTEMYIKMDEATHEFRILQNMVATQKIFDIPKQSEIVDGMLWYLKDAYGYIMKWEPEFRTIVKKYVDITDV
jgi:hypothetical protein